MAVEGPPNPEELSRGLSGMERALQAAVWERAAACCEYCRLPQASHPLPFQIDHIVAQQHHGATELWNLALACLRCNRFKGPNLSGIDPATGAICRLFHPRKDTWND